MNKKISTLFFGLFLLLASTTYAQKTNTIHVTSADNELYIIAVPESMTTSYQLLHVKTGWWKKVDVQLNITEGTFTEGYERSAINATQTNAIDIKDVKDLNLPKGKYAILMATIDWGVEGYSTVDVNGTVYSEKLKNVGEFNPMVRFKQGDEGKPIYITVE